MRNTLRRIVLQEGMFEKSASVFVSVCACMWCVYSTEEPVGDGILWDRNKMETPWEIPRCVLFMLSEATNEIPMQQFKMVFSYLNNSKNIAFLSFSFLLK